ncbi:hypothetical protein Droror1_Dr00020407 [Drosera rotundifolia]
MRQRRRLDEGTTRGAHLAASCSWGNSPVLDVGLPELRKNLPANKLTTPELRLLPARTQAAAPVARRRHHTWSSPDRILFVGKLTCAGGWVA